MTSPTPAGLSRVVAKMRRAGRPLIAEAAPSLPPISKCGRATEALAPALPAGVALIGLGIGPSLPNYTTSWLGIVPPGLRGRAAGMLTTAFFAGQFASPLITAPLVGTFGLPGSFQALALAQLGLAGVLGLAALRAGRAAVAA